ncbi:PAS domain S-box protein [Lacibacter sp. H375]|uniref:PAS domain S-box protein n=1 Tax=Lacibacter sp. H375 TaxID=3133424 RepID=UPI0030BE9370
MKKDVNGSRAFGSKQKLKDTGDYAKAIIETMHESLLMLTGDLFIRHANKGFYKTFCVTPEETEGCYLYDIANAEWNIPELKEQMSLLQSRDIPFTHLEVTRDFPMVGRRTVWLNANKFPMKEGKGSMILLAIQDITEQKMLEERLKGNEERLYLLLRNASDIITVFDEHGTIKYESPAIEPVLGYKPEERVGKNIHTDAIVHADDRSIKIELLQKAIESPTENISGEFRIRHKDGSYHIIEAIFNNMLENKKINGIIATYRDVTERKSLEQHKDEFIGIASHELKTPVTSLKAYLQILEENILKANGSQSVDILFKMNKQVDRLAILIKDLLDFTRIEGGKLKFREDMYELNELVLEIVDEVQLTTKQHKIQVHLSRPVLIEGDRYRTGQVLTNLLNNAIKYSPQGDSVVVRTKVDKQSITISVQDFGIGIEHGFLTKVFDRFFRVNETQYHHFPGLGLGLYIAAEFVKRQGGQIWVTSEPRKGSVFYFLLPILLSKEPGNK